MVASLVAALFASGAALAAAPPGVATEFSQGITPGSFPTDIVAGPDANLWFTELSGARVGRITTSGVVTELGQASGLYGPGPVGGITPGFLRGIAAGPDGNLWYTASTLAMQASTARIGKITTSGVVTEFTQGITPFPSDITSGPDGNLWFTTPAGTGGAWIGRITPLGIVTRFSQGISLGSEPSAITAGPDGNLWYTDRAASRIGRITTSGAVTEFQQGITPGGTGDIATGPDGNLWFTESSKVGRITTSGVVTEFSRGISGYSSPRAITAGPDGNLWFTGGTKVGRITPSGVVSNFTQGITPGTDLGGIAAGPDGGIWFTEPIGNRIGRITPPPPPKPLRALATLRVVFADRRARIVSLRLSRLVKGSRVEVRCLRGCSVRKTYVIKSGSTREYAALFRRRLLPARSVISVRITKPDALGRFVRWTVVGRRLVKIQCQVSTLGRLEHCVKV